MSLSSNKWLNVTILKSFNSSCSDSEPIYTLISLAIPVFKSSIILSTSLLPKSVSSLFNPSVIVGASPSFE